MHERLINDYKMDYMCARTKAANKMSENDMFLWKQM